jgi:predicted nucleic acid-binding protein
MSRIYWDSMLFIYLLEKHPDYASRVRYLLGRSYARADFLFTSYLTLGEVLAGADKSPSPGVAQKIRTDLDALGFSYLAFGEAPVKPFGEIRSRNRLKVADSIHLACAASAGIDVFLTGDRQLVGLTIPGIQFIVDFQAEVL